MPAAILSALSQKVLEATLSIPSSGLFNKAVLHALTRCRRLLARAGDPLVRHNLAGTEIVLPVSHDLPLYRKQFPVYASNVARIASQVAAKYADLTFIDIGANIGDTAVLLRNTAHFPILCIEGDARFFAILQVNAARLQPDIHLEHAFVSSEIGRVRGRVESEKGTARLVEDETSPETVAVRTLSDILAAHPLFARSKMIKVDTDGFDCHILQSELDLLHRLKPVLFFEYAPDLWARNQEDGCGIFESLQQIGYQSALVYENTGDYLLTAELSARTLIEDIYQFYSGRLGERYADICAFHAEDADLCQTIRLAEIEFFRRQRPPFSPGASAARLLHAYRLTQRRPAPTGETPRKDDL